MVAQERALAVVLFSLGCGSAVEVPSGDGSGSSGEAMSSSSSGDGSVESSTGSTTVPSTSESSTGPTAESSTGAMQPGYCLQVAAPDTSVIADALADVDGDGALEVWTLPGFAAEPEDARIVAHRVAGLDVDAHAFTFEAPADRFAFADIDGDGLDDVVRSYEGATVFHQGQPGLSVAEQGASIPGFELRIGTRFVDIDDDGDDDAVALTTEAPHAVEVWRNDAGSFALHGSASVTTTRGASFTALPVAGSTWIAVKVDLGAPGPFVLLDVDGGVDVLHQSDSTVTHVFGSYVDDEGPAIVASDSGAVTRMRWNGDTLQSVALRTEGTVGALGTYDELPMLLMNDGETGALLDLSTGESLPMTIETAASLPSVWSEGGIGSDGQVLFQRCSLANCMLEVGVLSRC